MARWKLVEPHYLNVDGTKWEYSEVDRITGRPKRTQFDVPTYMNPNYEDDVRSWGQDGDIIVSDGNNAMPKDVVFKGQPTPGMMPLDAEATEISARFKKAWTPPTEDNPSFSQNLMDGWFRQMSEMQTSAQKPAALEGVSELLASMAAMMKQNQDILAMLVARDAPPVEPKRKLA